MRDGKKDKDEIEETVRYRRVEKEWKLTVVESSPALIKNRLEETGIVRIENRVTLGNRRLTIPEINSGSVRKHR